jgi:hypothetical protein
VPDAPPAALHVLRSIALITAFLAVATPAFPANDIYKYVDDEGVAHYTDQWQLIPERYRGRIQALDPATGEIFRPESRKTAPPPPQSAFQPPVTHNDQAPQTAPADPPFYVAWLEKFSTSHLGAGLLGVAIIWGAFKIMRGSQNPLLTVMLKGVITIVLAGGAYALYVASLSDRISSATKTSPPEKISDKDLLKNIQGTTEKVRAAIKEKATAPLEKVKNATVGGAIQARDSLNQSNIEKEKALKRIESGP